MKVARWDASWAALKGGSKVAMMADNLVWKMAGDLASLKAGWKVFQKAGCWDNVRAGHLDGKSVAASGFHWAGDSV